MSSTYSYEVEQQLLAGLLNYPVKYNELSKLDLDRLISIVSMIYPFSVEEKQKLIETKKIDNKIKVFNEIINFNLLDYEQNKTIQ